MEVLISAYGPGGTKMLDETRTVPVTFVFMTGHTNTGNPANEWTFNANKQIRQHCLNNNRVLYDFYDIECYDPDNTYFGDGEENTTDYGTYTGIHDLKDDCSYDLTEGGRGNWATAWQNLHTEGVDWYNCSPAHTLALNGNRKAYAAWWLFARLAGWEGINSVTVAVKVYLEGPYNSGTMETDLETSGYIPLKSPYDDTTATSLPVNIVDWVQLEIGSEADGSGNNFTRSAFLRNDGRVVDLDGSENITINAPAGNYSIIVRHRNHLTVMSADQVYLFRIN